MAVSQKPESAQTTNLSPDPNLEQSILGLLFSFNTIDIRFYQRLKMCDDIILRVDWLYPCKGQCSGEQKDLSKS